MKFTSKEAAIHFAEKQGKEGLDRHCWMTLTGLG
jgi:hypothetical protein